MALGTGHIKKLFEEKQLETDGANLQDLVARLRGEAPHNPAAAAFLQALEADFPELREQFEATTAPAAANRLKKAA